MAALRGQSIISIDLMEVTQGQKFVDPNGEIVQSAKDIGISFGES